MRSVLAACRWSQSERPPPSHAFPHRALTEETHDLDELEQALVDAELEVLPDQDAIDVDLACLDDRIRFQRHAEDCSPESVRVARSEDAVPGDGPQAT